MRERLTLMSAALAAAAAAAASIAVFAGGGFDPVPRALFAAASGLTLVAALTGARLETERGLRSGPVLALFALAALAALSALWTVAEPEDALRWSLVVAGLGALAAASSAIASTPGGVRRIAAILCAIAVVAGVLGLAAAVLRAEPMALRLGRVWRPAGPFEYPPALALLQVSALPALTATMVRGRLALALPAAAAAAIAGAVVALADSRIELALAAAALAVAILGQRRSGSDWLSPVAATAVVAAAALAAHELFGSSARGDATGGDAGRVLALAGLIGGATAGWWLVRRLLNGFPSASARTRLAVLLAAASVAGVLAVGASSFDEPLKGKGSEPVSGVEHGRLDLWDASVETALERPLHGAGAEAFYAASLDDQGSAPVLYAHSLPLELWAELGLVGLLLALALYGTSCRALWRARQTEAAWLLGPAVAAFLLANLVDWPWHLAGAGAVWALALGGVLASARGSIGSAS